VLLAPETVSRSGFSFRLQRLGVPAEVMTVFLRAALAGVAAFAVAGVFSSVAPEFLGLGLHHHSPALAGLLVFLVFVMSVAGQALVVRVRTRSPSAAACSSPVLPCSPSPWPRNRSPRCSRAPRSAGSAKASS
jgi:hypothetical protein